MKQREIPILSRQPSPKQASAQTLRLCDTEEDAISVSIVLSGVSQAEIARRMGVSPAFVTLLKTGERTLTSKMLPKFCAATGSDLVRQFRTLQSLLRQATGAPRASDRIATIASYTQQAAA
jgi:hypothetical protein